MKRKRDRLDEDNPDRWIVSYADFITLLFAFFTALYAISRVDTGKLKMFAGSMRTAFHTEQNTRKPLIEGIIPVPENILRLEREVRKAVEAASPSEDISVTNSDRGVVISIGDRVLFDLGQAVVRESSVPSLAAIASILSRISNQVVVEGHTDNVPISGQYSKYATNWELSTARATSVLQFFISKSSLPPERIAASGYAEFRPVASNATPEGRAKNRRVDIVIVQDRKFQEGPRAEKSGGGG